jgi:hypothetical protein
MKKLIILSLTLLSINSFSQIALGESQFTAVNVLVNPMVTINKGGANLQIELERVENGIYIKTFLEMLSTKDETLAIIGASSGVNFKFGYFDNYRLYAGGKINFIRRNGNTYPSYGGEIGFDHILDNGLIIGIRGSIDWREDLKFYSPSYEPDWKGGAFIKLGWKF